MNRGKQTCKILKDIRRQIAAANDIELAVSECRYKGDCPGTCPRCEAEVRYLEQALERRRMAGKAVSLLGISAGLLATPAASTAEEAAMELPTPEAIATCRDTVTPADIVVVQGRVVDKDGRPLPDVTLRIADTRLGAISDSLGNFRFSAPVRDTLVVTSFGYETQRIPITRETAPALLIVMREQIEELGELPPVMVNASPIEAKESLTGSMPLYTYKKEEPSASIAIQGVIFDKEGRYLEGVEILQIGENTTTLLDQTDEHGRFDTRVILRRKRFMVAKEGYKPRKVRVGKRKNPESLVIVMKPKRGKD